MNKHTFLALIACTALGFAGTTSTAHASWFSQALKGQPVQPSRYYGNYGYGGHGDHHAGYVPYQANYGGRGQCEVAPYQYSGYGHGGYVQPAPVPYGYNSYQGYGHSHHGSYPGSLYGQPGMYGRW